jgi:cytoskeleton protein RodZ
MSEAAALADGTTAGMLLRHAREAAGLHVATLAANLKVPVRKLEALEEDRYDLLGDAVFVRALASSICRTLKVDPHPVLERLPQTASPRLVPEGARINAPFRAPGDGPSPGLLDQVSRPVVLIVGLLLIGALVIFFLPMVQRGYETVVDATRSEPVLPPPDAAATVPSVPAPVEIVPAADTAAAQPAPAATIAAAPATPLAGAAPTPAATASAANVAAAPRDAASGPIAAAGVVQFRARAASWVQVRDASGTTVFQRLMEPGESAGATGRLPLSVIIGSVQATEVQVRGKPYDLAPVSKDNVARFEVK